MIDIYLRADSASALLSALSAAGLTALDDRGEEHPVLASHRHVLAVLGTLYRPGRYGPGGEILAAPEPLPGYHANLRWLDGQPPAEMLALSIDPAPQTPNVRWAS